jgi:hypothetical protein
VSGVDLPRPWQIIDGPRALHHGFLEGRAWRFTLGRDGVERGLVVAVSPEAVKVARSGRSLPVQTREAIQTEGRSEAARAAQFDDPTSCVVLGPSGYLSAPPALARLARR